MFGKQVSLYIFSDGVYELKESDGPMWQFVDFMKNAKTDSLSKLDHLCRYAENIRSQDNFEDDFTIVEVAFG